MEGLAKSDAGGDVVSRILQQFPVAPAASVELMTENVRSSLARKLPFIKLCRPHNRLMSVVGGGPSLADTYKELRGVVFCANQSLSFLLERDVVPWACGVMDPRDHMADLIEPHPGVFYFLASTCHPWLFEKLLAKNCKVVLWHASGLPGMEDLIGSADMIAGGSTEGLRIFTKGFYLGFRNFEAHGLDSSFRGDATHAYPDRNDVEARLGPAIDGYRTNLAFLAQIEDYRELRRVFAETGQIVRINVLGDGLLQHLHKKDTPDVLHAYYDLHFNPLSYDVLTFLLQAEAERLARGLERIVIHIIPGPNDGFRVDESRDARARDRMYRNVVVDVCRLLPSVSDVIVHPSRPRAQFDSIGHGAYVVHTSAMLKHFREGIKPLRPPTPVIRNPRLVTITLREVSGEAGNRAAVERNSNFDEWVKAAGVLERIGYDVVFVRDTEKADEKIPGFKTSPKASRDIVTRATLYCGAAVNLFVSNGPTWLCAALNAPMIVFKCSTEGSERHFSRAWLIECGLEPDGQLPGNPLHQRMAWKDDVCGDIVSAVRDFVRLGVEPETKPRSR